ncbi:hypothetical protein [Nocardioides sp. YIM 152588]|uniref:hypothetical protein n=1 Tax=Nocardioides sp. YIM 152588 TaxID=3158259 RepID=UPI0032E3D349
MKTITRYNHTVGATGPMTLAELADLVDRADPAPAVRDASEFAHQIDATGLDRYLEALDPESRSLTDLGTEELIDHLSRLVPDPAVALSMVDLLVPEPAVEYLRARIDTRGWTPSPDRLSAGRLFVLDWIDLVHGGAVEDGWHELERD